MSAVVGTLRAAVGAGILLSLAVSGCAQAPATHAHVVDVLPGDRPTIDRAQRPLRPLDPEKEIPRFEPDDEVFSLRGEHFAVHYTRAGINAVDLADADEDGVPDSVQLVLDTYEEVRRLYTEEWGYLEAVSDAGVPGDNGGDALFDVYLIDFAGRADGLFYRECPEGVRTRCPGYIVQENDYAGYRYSNLREAVRILASHEYFHAVQSAYDTELGTIPSEATATLITERCDPSLDDFERQATAYLKAPERPLNEVPAGFAGGYPYGVALFLECVERSGEVDTVKALLERGGVGDDWTLAYGAVIEEALGSTLKEELVRCAGENLFTGSRAVEGYGHPRALRLAEAPVEMGEGTLVVERSRVFKLSSRYFGVAGLKGEAAVCWAPLRSVPEGAAEWLVVRLFQVGASGEVKETILPAAVAKKFAIEEGERVYVAASHVEGEQSSVQMRLSVVPGDVADPCEEPEKEPVPEEPSGPAEPTPSLPGEEPPPEEEGGGCASASAARLSVLALAAALFSRRRNACCDTLTGTFESK